MSKRNVILVQLPIPPVGPQAIRGNVPLAAGYLKMFARLRGLESHFDIQILPTQEANTFSDQGLVEAILSRDPWMVGFTCYLWNIERTLWIAERIKQRQPDVQILIGGPEVTLDNAWVLEHPAVGYAAIGEGEQTFAELLAALAERGGSDREELKRPIAGLMDLRSLSHKRVASDAAKNQPFTLSALHPFSPSPFQPFTLSALHPFIPRSPLPHPNDISSPYLAGILDAADEEMLLLETIRGCIFKCKFCYYPKSYDDLYFVSDEKIIANLEHAQRRGAKEVVLLDPTLNQRRNFSDFLKLLARCNPNRQFTYFGELRAEGITPNVAQLLHEAGFDEVEIGLQSIDPLAMELMDRHNNLKAFERGARAMLDLGIKVKVDLIIGLPGDTVDSVRRGIQYIRQSGLYSQVQVFNLAILPGTAFRQEAAQLGLRFQDRPPYYVLETPTLSTQQMYDLLAEAEDAFETEFDPLPEVQWPVVSGQWSVDAPSFSLSSGERAGVRGSTESWRVNLDEHHINGCPLPENRSQAFTLCLRSSNFDLHRHRAAEIVDQLLADNPFTTLQIVLEPTNAENKRQNAEGDVSVLGSSDAIPHPFTSSPLHTLTSSLTPAACETILQSAFRRPTYLDRFYSVQPGRLKGAKRLIVALPAHGRQEFDPQWLDEIAEYATIVWQEGRKESDRKETDVHPIAITEVV